MNVRPALLSLALLPAATASATTVHLTFTGSGYEVPISSDGAGNFFVTPGSCTPGSSSYATACIWQGTYTSNDPNFLSGSFTVNTSRSSSSNWLTGVQPVGNPNIVDINGADSDIDMTITLQDAHSGTQQFAVITNGVFQNSALAITGYEQNGNLYCNPGACSIAQIGANGGSFEGEALASFSFDDANYVNPVPEPSSLALLTTGTLGIAASLRNPRRRT